jgi:HEAT repeat protein
LPHVETNYVPSEGDMGSASATADEGAALVPWPTGGGGEEAANDEVANAKAEENPEAGASGTTRSDDWTAGDLTVEIEAGYEELEYLAPTEIERFQQEFAAEHAVSLVTSALAFGNAFLHGGAREEDRADLAKFLPRVLRQAVGAGGWLEAREALILLHQCGSSEWSSEAFAQELLQPISVSSAVQRLEAGSDDEVLHFIAFTGELGDPGLDWLNLVLAENQNRNQRRMLAEAIAILCKDRPERLAPWIADPRWFVVRNVVHILGWIGGPAIVPLLQVAARNPEPRVRQEVIAALGQVDIKHARSLLVRLLESSDTRQFVSVLHLLGQSRDAVVTRLLLGYLQDPGFDDRPADEKNAIYGALGTAAGDEAVPELEAELHRTQWFSRQQEAHRQAVARVLARIGTPTARMVLERGVQSRRAPVRQACEGALTGFRDAA